ncbi:hypothetical protein FM038_003340 [Shewanella eurypsychrophilus]|uniref:Uncharacterized protein n=1 Tax=Shewanella eurypsychrophilus TaxID=2593656 RepID=A0ABX6V4S4_9GAMM|nr:MULTISPECIES: hypothetical protein [Shewanella]QFU21273.1 hypothetical protein FS418_04920 [Shewanella sp. YLB-09]QPG56564.1 hypothetical protein FM038_003340 [Shewanella eurypsychrophilus]
MELYKQEFGQNFNLGFDLSQYPWLVDKSWHNDVSPSFYFKTSTGYMVLWVDYEDPVQREDSVQKRYVVMTTANSGTDEFPDIHHNEDSEVILETESPTELITYLNQLASAH